VSEDILPDRRKTFENGFSPLGNLGDADTSVFGRVPVLPQLNNAFDNEPSARPFQDVGLDGMNDQDERLFYSKYLQWFHLLF
jgi:cell surface protein SprA